MDFVVGRQPFALDDPAAGRNWALLVLSRKGIGPISRLSSASSARSRPRPMKAERRTALIKSIARGRAWLDEIVSGTASIEGIAARQKCSVRHVNMTISMAF